MRLLLGNRSAERSKLGIEGEDYEGVISGVEFSLVSIKMKKRPFPVKW